MSPDPLRQDLSFTRLPSGARLAWARSGRGPPLLRTGHWLSHLEHDAASALFRPWIEQLGRHATLLRYDERGSGLSQGDGTPPGVESAVGTGAGAAVRGRGRSGGRLDRLVVA